MPILPTVPKVLICGYYYRGNAGDDAFVSVLSKVWGKYQPLFRNIEQVLPEEVSSAELIILGGGDLLQSYFLSFVEKKILPYKKCPLYAVGVSIPYPSIIETGKLDCIDRFWCRFQEDVALLTKRYGRAYVQHIPDLALLTERPIPIPLEEDKFLIGVALPHSLVRGNRGLISQVETLLTTLSSLRLNNKEVMVKWLAFNTDSAEHESDLSFYSFLGEEVRGKVPVVSGADLLPTLVRCDLLVASRFHAHVFATLFKVPLLSLILTRKVERWLSEHKLEGINLPRLCSKECWGSVRGSKCPDCLHYINPVASLPLEEILVRVSKPSCSSAPREVLLLKSQLQELLSEPFAFRTTPPYYLSEEAIAETEQVLEPQWQAYLSGEITAPFLASLMCLKITGNPEHPFHYGLVQTLSTREHSTFQEALRYMLRTYYATEKQWSKSLVNHPQGLFSLSQLPQNRLEGRHRSGWNYVLDLLATLHNDQKPMLDSFIDQTFGWQSEYLSRLGIIPYKRKWYGFLHHPPKAIFSDNDASHLFQNPLLVQSLETCQGLFVMSSSLKEWVQSLGLKVPVHLVYHPTEFNVPSFTWGKYQFNPEPKLIQVGVWLRDPYAIYQVNSPLKKVALIPANSFGYTSKEAPEVVLEGNASGNSPCRDWACQDPLLPIETCRDQPKATPFLLSVQEMLKRQWESVEVQSNLSNAQYDTLLSQNIVLLPLLEAVAVNSLIECLVRNTPVLVPKLPAVVEYLGEDYPLYYTDYSSCSEKLNQRDLLRAHLYLTERNKEFLTGEYFLLSLREKIEGSSEV